MTQESAPVALIVLARSIHSQQGRIGMPSVQEVWDDASNLMQ